MHAQFTESGLIALTRADGSTIYVPDDMANRDRQEIAEWESQGNTIEPYDPGGVNDAQLLHELNRRLSLGFDYDFSDARGVHHFGTTEEDMKRWMDEVTPMAQAAINLGHPEAPIDIKTETGPVRITASEWFVILFTSGTTWRQPLFQAYFLMKAMDPIPEDYASDERWP